ncbi:MAG: LysM domain-containing protein [Steroidobacteraceae bacterium]
MSDMLNALIAAGALPQTSYGTSSRYYGLPVVELKMPDGSVIRYVRRRFIPQLANFPTLAVHQVQQGDRIDLVSARYLGDPLLYWRIADANLAVAPSDPLVLGNSVNIPGAARQPGGLT